MSGRLASTIEPSVTASTLLRQKLAFVRGSSAERFWVGPNLREVFLIPA
jgi:hypothetical protein